MVKLVPFQFQQCFGLVTMLLFKGSSQMGLFRYLSNHVFRVRNFKNKSAMRVAFFKKMFKFECKFPKRKEKGRKYFFFYRKLHLKMLQKVTFVKNIILVIGSQWVKRQS